MLTYTKGGRRWTFEGPADVEEALAGALSTSSVAISWEDLAAGATSADRADQIPARGTLLIVGGNHDGGPFELTYTGRAGRLGARDIADGPVASSTLASGHVGSRAGDAR